jgi:cytochrome c biogenesis protein CcmG/thiol:disulfide interchange protein DsbE
VLTARREPTVRIALHCVEAYLVVGVIVTQVIGCSVLTAPSATYVDYANAEQGAQVVTSGGGGPGAASLIDGITDPSPQGRDSTWHASWERARLKPGWTRRAVEDPIEHGAGWVEVRFDKSRRINRVVIHGVNTEDNPFDPYKEGVLQVRERTDMPDTWTTIGRIENRKATVPGHRVSDVSPKTTFRFNMTDVDAVRFVVYEMASAKTSDKQTYSTRYQTNTMTLVEIEITGTEIRDPVALTPRATDHSAADLLRMDLVTSTTDNSTMAATEETTAVTKEAASRVGITIGDRAPSFRLPTLSGETLDSAGNLGKIVLLNFWATWSAPCVREIPDLVLLANEMPPGRVTILGLCVDDASQEQIQEFVDRYGMNYPVALVDTATRAVYGGISSIPTTFIIDANGIITQKIVGMQSKDTFKRLLEQELGG